jgi:hypothetical protein
MKNKEMNLRMKCNQYKLIWFQHFHKAAGSTIVEYALMNNEKLYPNHANGNPLEKDGSLINLHTFSPTELTKFVDNCEKMVSILLLQNGGLQILMFWLMTQGLH